MPFEKVILRPGINRQATPTLNEGGWSFSALVRWKDGLLEKLGGWLRLSSTPLIGITRGLHAFQDLRLVIYLAAGSNQRLQLFSGGSIYDITPIRNTVNYTPDFSTTMGSSIVTVFDMNNGTVGDDWINIVCPVAVGGIVLLGFYQVITALTADTYTIDAGSNATSTVISGGVTPLFTTVNGSNSVTVTLINHGYVVTDVFTVQIDVVVGGLTITGEYLVDTVIDADNFTILTPSGASSDDTAFENNDEVRIQYLLSTGYASDTVIEGWGGGGFGEGPWGIGETVDTVTVPLRNWYLDNFGENLLALPTNGALYQWVPPLAAGNVATVVDTAPAMGTAMFVASPQAQVFILGAEVSSVQDPLLVRWSDNGDYTIWDATITNQAGSYRLSTGSRIVGGLQVPQLAMIWTDTSVWVAQYIGPPFIYGFNVIGQGCGLIASKAVTVLSNTVYWVSSRGFFMYTGSGGVQALPCAVWDILFANLDMQGASKILLGSNSLFNEFSCFFPSTTGGSGEIDSYVKYNTVLNLWDYGELVRTAWIDQSVIGNPIGIDENQIIQQHEIGYNADDEAMTSSAQSGYFDIAQGELFLFVDWIVPDILFRGTSPTVTITVYSTDYPGGTVTTHGPFTVNSTTTYINMRSRGRQMAIKVESTAINTFWRLGAIRYRGAPAGRV